MNSNLQKYQHKFTHLRQGVTKYGPAPHKPVLLLAVMDGFESGLITGNRIDLSPQLVGRFKSIWSGSRGISDASRQGVKTQRGFGCCALLCFTHAERKGG